MTLEDSATHAAAASSVSLLISALIETYERLTSMGGRSQY